MTDEERYQRQMMMDYREVFQSEAGQRVLVDICRLSGLFAEHNSSDPIELAKVMGMQDLARKIAVLHGRGIDVFMEALKQGEQNERIRFTGNGADGTIDGWIS